MKVVLQYANQASVSVSSHNVAAIQTGYVVLVAFSRNDDQDSLKQMARQIIHLRTIPDDHHKINLSITDIQGDILIVPQFTLYADTRKGHRPNFAAAAPPQHAQNLYHQFISIMNQLYPHIHTGQFGAHMQVNLKNNGPITIILDN